jgi:peptide/nickel transport system substrate-binding protein
MITTPTRVTRLQSAQPRRAAWLFPVAAVLLLPILSTLCGCSNNPYPAEEAHRAVIYRYLGDDPKRLDPSVSYVVTEGEILSLICNSYFQYDYLKQSPFKLELGIGAVMPTRQTAPAWVMQDGKKVTKTGELWSFRLKPGLLFQDDECFPGGKGREVTASDIIYSFKRMADPSVPCPVLAFFEDKVVGLKEYHDHQRELAKSHQPADYVFPVEGLQTDPKDKYTFRILLNQPYPQLRYLMAMNFTTPIPREAVEHYGPDFRRHPVGCGPFMLTEWSPKLRLVLKRNPNFRVETYPSEGDPGDREAGLLVDAGKRLPLSDEVVYTIIKEGLTGWNLFQQGYLDDYAVIKESFSQVVSQQGTLTPQMAAKGIKLDRSREPNIGYYAFNMRDPVVGGYTLEKRRLRQAISMAINVQKTIDLFASGLGTPAQFLIPPGIFGYEKDYRNPYRHYNVAAAKKLLAEAGYPGGIDPKTGDRLTITFDNTATSAAGRQFVVFLKDQFDRLGIRLASRSSRPEVWQDRIDRGDYQFIHYGWLADYPDPENFVFLLYGPNRRPGPNSAAYDNPEYNRLFEQMRSMDDGPERLAIIRKMRAIAVEDCPWVFDDHGEGLDLHYDWQLNMKRHPIALDSAKYIRIDAGKRARLRDSWNHPSYWPLFALATLVVVGTLPAVFTVRNRRLHRLRRNG